MEMWTLLAVNNFLRCKCKQYLGKMWIVSALNKSDLQDLQQGHNGHDLPSLWPFPCLRCAVRTQDHELFQLRSAHLSHSQCFLSWNCELKYTDGDTVWKNLFFTSKELSHECLRMKQHLGKLWIFVSAELWFAESAGEQPWRLYFSRVAMSLFAHSADLRSQRL